MTPVRATALRLGLHCAVLALVWVFCASTRGLVFSLHTDPAVLLVICPVCAGLIILVSLLRRLQTRYRPGTPQHRVEKAVLYAAFYAVWNCCYLTALWLIPTVAPDAISRSRAMADILAILLCLLAPLILVGAAGTLALLFVIGRALVQRYGLSSIILLTVSLAVTVTLTVHNCHLLLVLIAGI